MTRGGVDKAGESYWYGGGMDGQINESRLVLAGRDKLDDAGLVPPQSNKRQIGTCAATRARTANE